MALELFNEPAADVIWDGRPDVGIRVPDLCAAACAFATTFAVLSAGLAYQNDWAWGLPLKLGAAYGAIVAVITALGRAAGGGLVITVTAAFWATIAAAALYTTQDGMALLCPVTLTAVVGTVLVMRYRQRRATRYQLTNSTVILGEKERYVIKFPLVGTPTVRRDIFGRSLGDVVFEEVDATLTTQDGKVIRVPSQKRRFHRVRYPERLLEAVAGRVG